MSFKEIKKLLEANTGARRMSQVFDDWTEMFAVALRNTVDLRGRDEREQEYLRVAGQYDEKQLARFAEAFAHVVNLMTVEPTDVLGRTYMELDLGNEALGQFYTPYDIAALMAEMQADSLTSQVERNGFAQIYEPACGAGAFMIAASEAFRAKGFNPQTQLHVTAEDLSTQAVHMIYIHLTLLHIPAVIHRRNTLTLETFDTWCTPAHILGDWSRRLRFADGIKGAQELFQAMPEIEQIEQVGWDDVFAEVK